MPLAAQAAGEKEPNLAFPASPPRYVAGAVPDRIVASPAEDAARGFAVNWRTDTRVREPLLQIREAVDSPDTGQVREVRATTRRFESDTGVAHVHRADIDGLKPATLYMFRVAGQGGWSDWRQLRTLGEAGQPLSLLYFGDTQNKNLSQVSRLTREAMRHAGDATLALYAGDLVSKAVEDEEWGEWFQAAGDLPAVMLLAPAIGNHEYWEEGEDTPNERRVLGAHWSHSFALPGNGAAHPHSRETTYWFDAHGVRVAVLDGTSALDLGSLQAQADWLDTVLAGKPGHWSLVLIHQPMFSPRGRGASDRLREALLPVIEKHGVDVVLQGHDHTYGRRSGERAGQTLPQYIVTVAGPKQYRLTPEARQSMAPVGEDTLFFQTLRISEDRLHYQARTVTGRLYDDFEIRRAPDGRKVLQENRAGRIPERDCRHRDATPGGRSDRCWD